MRVILQSKRLRHPLFARLDRAARLRLEAIRETRLNISLLLWGLLFSSVGLGFFLYGRKQRAPVPLVCGLALMIFPYFISNAIVLVAIGVALIAVPYFVRI